MATRRSKSLKIRSLISTEYTNVSDGRTPHDDIGRAYAYHRAAKKHRTLRTRVIILTYVVRFLGVQNVQFLLPVFERLGYTHTMSVVYIILI